MQQDLDGVLQFLRTVTQAPAQVVEQVLRLVLVYPDGFARLEALCRVDPQMSQRVCGMKALDGEPRFWKLFVGEKWTEPERALAFYRLATADMTDPEPAVVPPGATSVWLRVYAYFEVGLVGQDDLDRVTQDDPRVKHLALDEYTELVRLVDYAGRRRTHVTHVLVDVSNVLDTVMLTSPDPESLIAVAIDQVTRVPGLQDFEASGPGRFLWPVLASAPVPSLSLTFGPEAFDMPAASAEFPPRPGLVDLALTMESGWPLPPSHRDALRGKFPGLQRCSLSASTRAIRNVLAGARNLKWAQLSPTSYSSTDGPFWSGDWFAASDSLEFLSMTAGAFQGDAQVFPELPKLETLIVQDRVFFGTEQTASDALAVLERVFATSRNLQQLKLIATTARTSDRMFDLMKQYDVDLRSMKLVNAAVNFAAVLAYADHTPQLEELVLDRVTIHGTRAPEALARLAEFVRRNTTLKRLRITNIGMTKAVYDAYESRRVPLDFDMGGFFGLDDALATNVTLQEFFVG